jgi:hypothetical protein
LLSIRPRDRLSTTRLDYRDSDDEDTNDRKEEHEEAASRIITIDPSTSLPSPKPTEGLDGEQYVLDDYLEFVDRRYQRLHGDGYTVNPVNSIGSAWSWLNRDPNASVGAKQQEDALCVLGLAGLASQRLLHKHHLNLMESGNDLKIASSEPMEVCTTSEVVDIEAKPLNIGTRVLRKVGAARLAFIELQTRYLFAGIRKTMRFISLALQKTSEAFVKYGGGRETLTAATAFAASLVVIAKPLGFALLRKSSNA